MDAILELWIPIVLATIAVFIASSLLWMVSPHHKADVKAPPGGEKLERAVEDLGLEPGTYIFPYCADQKNMKDEAFRARWEHGPWGTITVFPAASKFGKNLAFTALVFFVITLFVGYLTRQAVEPGAEYLRVFQIAGTAAVLGHVFGGLPYAIFFGKPARFVITDLIDAIIYAMITAGILAAMWPGAEAALPEVDPSVIPGG